VRNRWTTAGIWLAVGGSVLEGVAIVLISLAFVDVMAQLSSELNWQSVALALGFGAVPLALAYGFVRKSRSAFVLGFLLYGWTLAGQLWIVISGNYLAQTVIPYAFGVPAGMVVLGLVLSWPLFLRRSGS
jgi:hypothetical protein